MAHPYAVEAAMVTHVEGSSASATSRSVSFASTAAGDLAIVSLKLDASRAVDHTGGGGWKKVVDDVEGQGFWHIYVKVVEASEPNLVLDWSVATNAESRYWRIRPSAHSRWGSDLEFLDARGLDVGAATSAVAIDTDSSFAANTLGLNVTYGNTTIPVTRNDPPSPGSLASSTWNTDTAVYLAGDDSTGDNGYYPTADASVISEADATSTGGLQIDLEIVANVIVPLTCLQSTLRAADTNVREWSRSAGSWNDDAAASTASWDHWGQAITGAEANGDNALGLPAGHDNDPTNRTIEAYLTDTPVDFESMDAMEMRVSGVDQNTYADDAAHVSFEVRDDSDTILAENVSTTPYVAYQHTTGGAWVSELGSPSYDETTNNLTLTATGLAASKADWDAAHIIFYFNDDRNMGSDNASILIVDWELLGIYTPAPERVPTLGLKQWAQTRRPIHVGALY